MVAQVEEQPSIWSLPAEPRSVSEARREACAAASDYLDGERLRAFELVISEVVTNAVRHGGDSAEFRLAVTPEDGYLCVQVTDSGDGLVPRPGAMGSDDEGGFGLFLVERLTRRWGVTRESGNTRVWFEFDFA